MASKGSSSVKGVVFNIQRFCVHDGPGIRTTVFLKGCPLRCLWCANPESINARPELGFSSSCCDGCAKCLTVCRFDALSFDARGELQINRKGCSVCGDCVSVCAREALAVYGKEWSSIDVFDEVSRDASFFRASGGGVTLSGGEPLRQHSFAVVILRTCREAGIHTVVETSGFFAAARLPDVLAVTDYFLFDLKQMDGAIHRRLVGEANDLILRNARAIVASGVPVQFRLPLIPSINDTAENIQATAHFIRELQGSNASIELMPYHRLGIGKYEALDRKYSLGDLTSMLPEAIDRIRDAFDKRGVTCLVSG